MNHDLLHANDPSAGVPSALSRYVEEEPIETGPRMISDPQQMIDIFHEVLTEHMPDAATIARYRAANHRRFLEPSTKPGEIEIDNFTGAVTEAQWRWTVAQLLDGNNLGTGHNTKRSTQGNGTWVPVACVIERGTVIRNDGFRPLPGTMTGIPETERLTDCKYGSPGPVRVNALLWRIEWMDAANAPELKYDHQGKLLADVNVNVGTDPATADAMNRQAEAMTALAEAVSCGGGGGGGTDPALVDAIHALARSVARSVANPPAAPAAPAAAPERKKPGPPKGYGAKPKADEPPKA